MFLPSRGTPYDLRFGLFGIPVTVSPFFWVTAMLLGFRWLQVEPGGPANLLAWILCVFLSLILHEFGHALTMRAFGHHPEVVLHHFGGYATYNGRETPGRSLIISAAGPGAQLLLFVGMTVAAGLWLGLGENSLRLFSPGLVLRVPSTVAHAFAAEGLFASGTPLFVITDSLLWINLIWPIFNLFPVLPLDGGRILASLLELARVRRAQMWAMRVGVGLGTLAAVYFLLNGGFLVGAMFAFMAIANYQGLQGERIEGV